MTTLQDHPTLTTDIDNDLTRRRFLGSGAALGGALLLGGCADDDDEAQAASSPSPTASAGPRAVSDVFGSITVPPDPQRIVTLDDQTLGTLLALGIGMERIAGWARGETPVENYPYLAQFGDLGSIANVGGTFDNPNIEGILAVRPDLMMMVAEDGADFYTPIFDKLRNTGIPVFGAYNGYLRFDDYLRLLADVGIAVNRVDRAAELAGGLRDRIAEIKARAGDDLPSAAFLRVPSFGGLGNVVMPLLDALGFPGERPTPEKFYVEVSPERLDIFDHDVLFVSDADNEEATRTMLEANPLWERLPAVRAGRAYFVSDLLWGTGYSLPAVEAMLDDIEDLVLNELTATPTSTAGN